jgi:methylated-DNA-[protein]-cysteine S-methyltransferase
MPLRYDTFPTPLGKFTAALDEGGALAATAFGGLRALGRRIRLEMPRRDRAALRAARREIQEFLAGKRRTFSVQVNAAGTPFQRSVWTALRKLPPGRTRNYGEIAQAVGRPGAARAVGGAIGANPVCVVVPCHRVIGADGSLTGFAFGERLKRRLLELEQRPH